LANVRLHFPDHLGPILEQDLPDADAIIATWWETIEWIWNTPASKGNKVHFIQGYDSPPDDVGDRVNGVWRLPTSKIAVAQWLVDLGRERFGIDDIALVPNSVEQRFFGAPQRPKGEAPTIGFLYHNADFKDIPTTLAAVQRLKQVRPEVRLVSFGSMMPARGELPSDVEFHHLPTQETIANIYARCDAWISTSRTEGFNLPPLEAMASGCPAVCAKTGRPLEIIEDGVNGYLVDQGDVAGFADALANILRLSDQAWRSMSGAARRSVAHPTWDESSLLFEQAVRRVL
jgi:glycosyltransferase involved in cell wall biosynthesis